MKLNTDPGIIKIQNFNIKIVYNHVNSHAILIDTGNSDIFG